MVRGDRLCDDRESDGPGNLNLFWTERLVYAALKETVRNKLITEIPLPGATSLTPLSIPSLPLSRSSLPLSRYSLRLSPRTQMASTDAARYPRGPTLDLWAGEPTYSVVTQLHS